MSVINQAQPMTESNDTDLYNYLITLIKQVAATYLANEHIDYDVDKLPLNLSFSAQASFGDYSLPVMPWAGKKVLGRPPLQIAEALVKILKDRHDPAIADVTATKPGYLNFLLNHASVGKDIIARVLESGPDFGLTPTGIGTKVIVEHTAINSNKAAHVGHLRNSCIGDTVVRMLRSQGYTVEAQNYIDDSGVQVADVVVGLTLLQQGELQIPGGNEQLPDESFDYYCSRVYVAVGHLYETQPEYKELRRTILHAIEQG